MTLRGCLCALALAAAVSPARAANIAAGLEAPSVEIVATTPLPGLGSPIGQVPANVQAITDAMLAGRQAPQLADQLRRLAGSVNLNEAQANPYQPDLAFRGFAASPLLGTPQGLSVFQDGVRINEGFGDAVNWDLLPSGAISSVQLLPGSHAVFGFNTLGGALVVNTKSGFRHPGGLLRAGSGSHGRAAVEFEAGGGEGERDFFAAGEFVRERGWREHSASRIDRIFAKAGVEGERDDLDVSLTLADNTLSGTQTLPVSMLDRPRQPYTWPDTTDNRLVFLNARRSRVVSDAEVLVGNLYYRGLESHSLSSNVNDDCTPRCAVNDALRLSYDRVGGGLQLTRLGTLLGRGHRFSLGLALDFGSGRFTGEAQDADFTADRGTAGVGPFALRTRLAARQQAANLYASDTLSLTPALHLTASLSASRAAIAIRDASGTAPALDGEHRFFRVNPALGLAWTPDAATSWFADLSQGMRVPTPMELTCADANAPCQLPNVFLADPPLKPVLARTLELGVRRRGAGLAGSLAVFRTELTDDIQFVANSAAATAGYFQNLGRTRRQGFEAALDARLGGLALALRYSLLEATYRSGFAMPSANNSSADAAGGIAVAPGDRLPGIPRQTLKVSADWTAAARTRLAVDLLVQSAQYARGDENNRDAAGPVPGFAVVNFEAERWLEGGWRLTAALSNAFDRRYASFGVLGRNYFVNGGFDAASARAEQFRSPGAPRALWLALSHSWEKESTR